MKNYVSLTQAADLVTHAGDKVTFLLQGEPGIGKSAMLPPIAKATGLKPVYIDCTLLDVGDVQMPRVSDTTVNFVPNGMFVSDQPLLVMLDEIGKAPRAVQNVLLPLAYEHRVGAHHLPEGSRVFCTTNLSTDGVGDRVEAHAVNRMSILQVRKPSVDEWLLWASRNNVHAVVCAWVKQYPHCLASYTDGEHQHNNPYIFVPTKSHGAYVTPRSLERASHLIHQHSHFEPAVLRAALAGTIGISAAEDMEAFLALRGEVAGTWDQIKHSPHTAKVSNNPLASLLLVYAAIQVVDATSAEAWMQYLYRLDREMQMLFGSTAFNNADLLSVLHKHSPTFTKWIAENKHALRV